jgi:hypothetical protein
LEGYISHRSIKLDGIQDKLGLFKEMCTRFITPKGKDHDEKDFSSYIQDIYSQKEYKNKLVTRIKWLKDNIDNEELLKSKWISSLTLFSKTKSGGENKIAIKEIVKKIVDENGNFIILDLSQNAGEIENENLQARFVTLIGSAIVETGAYYYGKGKKANALIVMDEAHRFISTDSKDERIKELTKEIVDSVRTTRKYGIGYMFITQTIESLDEEIIRQMRIFGFGYGLTSGQELRKVSEVVNNTAAIKLYKSFIDPSSNGKFPFMFFGPISPLSFTGSPLFIEVYKDFKKFK